MIKIKYDKYYSHWDVFINLGFFAISLTEIQFFLDRRLTFKPDKSFLFFLLLAHPWAKPWIDKLSTDPYLDERIEEAKKQNFNTWEETLDWYDPIPL